MNQNTQSLKTNQDEHHLTWPTQSILVAKKMGKNINNLRQNG